MAESRSVTQRLFYNEIWVILLLTEGGELGLTSTVFAGEEPYRKLGLKVYEKPQASVEECRLVLNTQDRFWRCYQDVSQQCSLTPGSSLGWCCN